MYDEETGKMKYIGYKHNEFGLILMKYSQEFNLPDVYAGHQLIRKEGFPPIRSGLNPLKTGNKHP